MYKVLYAFKRVPDSLYEAVAFSAVSQEVAGPLEVFGATTAGRQYIDERKSC